MLSTFSRRMGEYVLTQTYKVFPGHGHIRLHHQRPGLHASSSIYNTISVQMGSSIS